jgi:hypothetical protein
MAPSVEAIGRIRHKTTEIAMIKFPLAGALENGSRRRREYLARKGFRITAAARSLREPAYMVSTRCQVDQKQRIVAERWTPKRPRDVCPTRHPQPCRRGCAPVPTSALR